MAKNVLQSTILSANGGVSIAPGAQIEIRNPAGLLVPLWLDRDGTQPTSNPFTADSNGFFRVYLDSGRYHITASKDGKTQEWRDVLLGSAAGYDVGTEPDQVPTNGMLGTAATYDVTTSPTDTTPGRVLTVEAFGLGKPTADPIAPITGSLLSGAMLAAGAIVEMGENANGSYWRWESGLQVCVMHNIPNSQITADTVYTATITFPAEFVRDGETYPLIFPVLAFGPDATNDFSFNYLGTTGITASTFTMYAKVTATQTYPIRAIAIGQWK